MKRCFLLLLTLSLLLTGCSFRPVEDPDADPGTSDIPAANVKTEEYLPLSDELEQARQVRLELGSEAQELAAFAATMERMRDQGLEFLGYGMPRQAAWCLSFVGGSVSAVRYAAQQILGEESTGFSGWDTIGAINYCTPVPFLCEAVAAEQAGNTERAAACWEMADYNFLYLVDGTDALSTLAGLSESGLSALVEGLTAFEEHIYWFYPADPQPQERCAFEWSPEYHLNLAGAYEELGLQTLATESYLNALAADPFSPDVYAFCAKAMYVISDVNLMQTYIEEGLLLDPGHGTLNALGAMLWSAAGDTERAQACLKAARAAELSEEEKAICNAVDTFMKGG